MNSILKWLRSFVLKSSPHGSAARSSAETMISKIKLKSNFIADPKVVERFIMDVIEVEREYPDANQAALSKLLIGHRM